MNRDLRSEEVHTSYEPPIIRNLSVGQVWARREVC
jgi:hypothetical protein